MCEEHSVIAILRREKFPKYLSRKKEICLWFCVISHFAHRQRLRNIAAHTEHWGGGWGESSARVKKKKKFVKRLQKSLAFAKIWSSAPLGALLAQGLLLFKVINSQLNFYQCDWLSQYSPINVTELEDREEI